MTRNAMHTTEDVVTVFARQGVSIATISRAMAIPTERVWVMCRRSHANDELQMMPPETQDDPRLSLLVEVTNLRAQLDTSRQEVRDLMCKLDTSAAVYVGVAKMTHKEAAVVGAIAKSGRASRAAIWHALYGGLADDEQREPKIIDVFVCKIRAKLKPFGVEIGTIWGTGYSMAPESVARLKELAAAPVVESPSLAPELAA